MQEFKGGKAIFSNPPPPIKCAGAPLKIMFLSEEKWRKKGVKNNTQIEYNTALPVIFGVPKYAEKLINLTKNKNIAVNFKHKLVEVRGKDRIAVFEDIDNNNTKKEVQFDILHAVPPNGPPQVLKNTKNLVDAGGFIEVDPNTLRSKKFSNVWALGDCAATTNAKTAAAIMSQTPCLVHNIMEVWKKSPENQKFAHYSGYASCPIFTGDKKLLLAEFKYGGVIDETFPSLLQDRPRWFFYLLKVYLFRWVYFNLMPKGLWYGKTGIIKPCFKTHANETKSTTN